MRNPYLPLVVFVLVAITRTLTAQDSLAARQGIPIRLHVAPNLVQRGNLEALTSDTVFFRRCSTCAVQATPHESVTRIEVDVGPGGYPLTGAVVGLLAGAAIGAFIVNPCSRGNAGADGPGCGFGQGMAAGGGAMIGLVVGTAVGAWILPRRHWKRVHW